MVGTDGFSDAGVFEVGSDLLMVQSLDFFAPLVDDPYLYGQIAAANSLSDVFAMGAEPATALNIVCFPDDKLGLEVLSEILKGGTDKVHEAGATVVGGHSIRDSEIKYGLSVTGLASRSQLLTNRGAKPGDALVLTKMLGTGFVTTAMKKNKCSTETADAALQGMATLNMIASRAAREHNANASTDITGFGLAIHACEMAQASDVTLTIELDRLAILPGALELANQGFVTRANKTNESFCRTIIDTSSVNDHPSLRIIYDPQTSGGLLLSVPVERADELVAGINSSNSTTARVVGSVRDKSNCSLQIV